MCIRDRVSNHPKLILVFLLCTKIKNYTSAGKDSVMGLNGMQQTNTSSNTKTRTTVQWYRE